MVDFELCVGCTPMDHYGVVQDAKASPCSIIQHTLLLVQCISRSATRLYNHARLCSLVYSWVGEGRSMELIPTYIAVTKSHRERRTGPDYHGPRTLEEFDHCGASPHAHTRTQSIHIESIKPHGDWKQGTVVFFSMLQGRNCKLDMVVKQKKFRRSEEEATSP